MGTVTREAAAVMVARAAKLCGMDTEMDATATRNMLAQFGDYLKTSGWARTSLAFCYREDILSQAAMDIQPKQAIKRCDMAQMLFNLLGSSDLL